MRYTIAALTAALLGLFAIKAAAGEYVEGYTRDNGTYVQGHYRSQANGVEYDNYSADGNINPYTGEEGHRDHEYSIDNDLDTDLDTEVDPNYD